VRSALNQIDDLLDEINKTISKKQRVLVTTLTKRMAEELSKYFLKLNIKCTYIHSDVATLDRVEIMRNLRLGVYDVLVGVNLLREGLDLPEVSLVAILDADKEGFLRSNRSLTQTAGRAARNIDSKVIMYADKITKSMQQTIDETNRRRKKQLDYNLKNKIIPAQIIKSTKSILAQTAVADSKFKRNRPYIEKQKINIAADPVVRYMTTEQIKKTIIKTKYSMNKAAKELNFIEATRLRDELYGLQKILEEK